VDFNFHAKSPIQISYAYLYDDANRISILCGRQSRKVVGINLRTITNPSPSLHKPPRTTEL